MPNTYLQEANNKTIVFIEQNFDIIQSITSSRAINVRPGMLGTLRMEYGFEVDMINLKKINQDTGIVEFSTGNYPFGGLDRFIITLAAYNLKPIMCFDGFNKCEITWNSLYQYNLNILPKTE